MAQSMKIYTHKAHDYYDRATHVQYQFDEATVRDVPDDLATLLVNNHPTKFCDVTANPLPETHRCKLTLGYSIAPVLESPEDRMMRPAQGVQDVASGMAVVGMKRGRPKAGAQ